jgi:hypothetical protein
VSGDVVIKDGRSGRSAGVNEKNQIESFATSRAELTDSLLNGDAFIITTPAINLTTDNLSAILYLENTNSATWIMNRFFVNIGPSNVSGEHQFQLLANADGGTLVSAGTDFPAANLNFGSAKTLDAIIKHGAEGSTATDAQTIIDSIVPATGARTALIGDNFIIPPGTNAVVTVTPPTGNTSMNAQVGFLLHRLIES